MLRSTLTTCGKLDTRSVFFGFLIGFCFYLLISHFLLNALYTEESKQKQLTFSTNNLVSTTKWQSIVPWTYFENFDISKMQSINLKPLPLTDSEKKEKMEKDRIAMGVKYGGKNIDQMHLGGWKFNDSDTYEREMWDWAINVFNITSILDVGCGIGCSTVYFENHKNVNDVLCIEGSIDAINNSLVPNISINHDYTLGPFWPNRTFDMVWSAEFLEHVKEEYIDNVMATFKSAKILFVTHSNWGGWHHVNVHESEWWIYKMESYGFQFQSHITQMARDKCPLLGVDFQYSYHDLHTDGNRKNSHFHFRGLVFFNKLYLNRMTEFDKLALSQFRLSQ